MKRILLSLSLLAVLLGSSTLSAALAAKNADEASLIKVLQSAASDRDKSDACAKLKTIATAKSVKALSGLLTSETLSHSARYVLETLPSSKAETALRNALKHTSGDLQVGIINSLGIRRDVTAVGDLTKLLSSRDASVAAAAAEALGNIGGASSLKKLQATLPYSIGSTHRAIAGAILTCAHALLADDKRPAAFATFQNLYNAEKSPAIRQGAYRGMILSAGARSLTLTLDAFVNGDAPTRAAALQAAALLNGSDVTKALADFAVGAPAPTQFALVACLVQRHDPVAAPALIHLADSSDASVRIAAIAALGALGDDSAVLLLANKAATAGRDERDAARQALLELNRGAITDRLVATLNSDSPKVKSEAFRALGGRGDASAMPALLRLAQNGKDDERADAIQAVGQLADATRIPDLVQLVSTAETDDLRAQAAEALGGVYLRVASATDQDVAPLVKAITTGDTNTRTALLPICSELSQKTVRETLRAAIKDSDTRVRDVAIHALCDTHDPELLPDLLDLAEGKGGDNVRPLAIRGVVHLTSQEEDVKIPADKKLEAYTRLLHGNLNADEKRLVLSGIATVSDPRALDLAETLLHDSDVQVESEQAVIAVCRLIRPAHTPRVRTTMKKLIAESQNAANRKAAQDLMDLLK